MSYKTWLLLPLLLVPWFAASNSSDQDLSQQQQQQIAGGVIPAAEEGSQYAIDSKLLATVEHTKVVHTRFLEYGPKYLMVQGLDTKGKGHIVWLAGNVANGGIRVVSETSADAYLSEAQVREQLQDQGAIGQLFLAPNDRVEGAGKNKPIWFVEFADGHVVYLDPVSGQKVS